MNAAKGTFWLPEAGSTIAKEVDAGWNLVFGVATFFFLLVVAAMVYFVIRYRRRSEKELPQAPDHNTRLEVVWTVIPVGIVMALFYVGFRGFLSSAVAPAESLEVGVTAQRWMWTFTYPDGTTSINELRVPLDKPVKLIMSSKDVLHSFYVPAFRIKRDVVPGRYNTIWFQATAAGETDLYCAEYCGTGHSAMLAKVIVMPEREFEDWLQTGGADKNAPPAELGSKLFVKMACVTCHSTDGSAKTGPSLKGVFGSKVTLASGGAVEADENYVRESIENPAAKVVQGYQPVMPVFRGLLSQKQVDDLIAYIKSLK